MKKSSSTFPPEAVVICREPHFSEGPEGQYAVRFGQRLRAGDHRVRKNPEFFVADGEDLVPFVPPEPEPEPVAVKRPPKRYAVKRSQIIRAAVGHEEAVVALDAGQVIVEGTRLARMLGPDVLASVASEITA